MVNEPSVFEPLKFYFTYILCLQYSSSLLCLLFFIKSYFAENIDISKTNTIQIQLQDLGVGKERVEVEQWAGQFSPTTNGIMVQLSTDHSVLLTLSDSGHIKVKRNLQGSMSATVVNYDDRDYILSVERSGHEVCWHTENLAA